MITARNHYCAALFVVIIICWTRSHKAKVNVKAMLSFKLVQTERKRTRKQKNSLMFFAYSLIFLLFL